MEPMVRIELTTCSLRVSCSTSEPHRHFTDESNLTSFFPFRQALRLYYIKIVRDLKLDWFDKEK